MTGQDFGYDIESWRHWVSREFNPNAQAGPSCAAALTWLGQALAPWMTTARSRSAAPIHVEVTTVADDWNAESGTAVVGPRGSPAARITRSSGA